MPATLPQLEQAMFNAHKAGDTNAARKLAAVINRERQARSEDPAGTELALLDGEPILQETVPPTQDPTLGQTLLGTAETGLTMATGMTGGLIGQIEGSVEGILREVASGEFGSYEAADRVEQLALKRAQQLTYTPRTESGQDQTKAVGEALGPLAALPPLAETQLIANAASRVPVRALTKEKIIQPAQQVAQEISKRVKERLPTQSPSAQNQSVGAAQVASPGTDAFKDIGILNSATAPAGHRKITELPFSGDSVAQSVIKAADDQNPDWRYGLLDLKTSQVPKDKIIAMQPWVEDKFIRPIGGEKAPLAIKIGEEYYVFNGTHRAVGEVQQGAADIPLRVFNVEGFKTPGTGSSIGTGSSVGAAQVSQAVLRQGQADELPVPIKLTEGQKTRDFEAQRFERETAKLPEEGAPIRSRFEEQNLQLQQNMDEFIDMTGSQITDLRGVGEIVDKALRTRAAKDKVRIRTLYKEAEKSGEMEAPVQLNSFVEHLVESAPEATVANVLQAVKAKAIQIGAVVEGPDGQLIAKPVSLKDAELLRRSINGATNAEPTNIRQASIMKKLIDDTTETVGGAAYKKARAARRKYAQDYENVGLVKNLLGLKRGSDDRSIALEDVLRKSIIEPSASVDSVRQVRRLLQTSGDEGKQAWKELQGGTLRHIQDQMLKGVTTNQRGDRVVSPAQLDRVLTSLDKTGKLDFVFGKKGAEQLRTINDVAKTVLTAPPGAVNHSNTATVLAGLMDVAMTGATGVPAPIASSFRLLTGKIKDAKLKARIKQTLGE